MTHTPKEISLINETSAWKRQIVALQIENQALKDRVQELAVTLEQYKRESRRGHV